MFPEASVFHSRHKESILQVIGPKQRPMTSRNYEYIDEGMINTNPNISILKKYSQLQYISILYHCEGIARQYFLSILHKYGDYVTAKMKKTSSTQEASK